MSNLSGPTGPEDPYGKIRVNEVQKDAQEEDLSKRIPPRAKSSAGVLKIIRMLQKFLNMFQSKSERKSSGASQVLSTDLTTLKIALDELKLEDLSSDSDYLARLSVSWHLFLLEHERHKNEKGLEEIMTEIKSSIDQYRANQEFSLGHYLTEVAGSGWTPFPCAEILKSLHKEHHQNPSISHLKKWTDLIDKILLNMGS